MAADREHQVVLALVADRVGQGDHRRAHAALALHVEHVQVAGFVWPKVQVGLAEAEHADDVEQHLADQRGVVVGVDAVVRAQRVRQLLHAPGREHRRDQPDDRADRQVLVGVEHVLAQHVLAEALLDPAKLRLRVTVDQRGLLGGRLLEEGQRARDAKRLVELPAGEINVEQAMVAGVARGLEAQQGEVRAHQVIGELARVVADQHLVQLGEQQVAVHVVGVERRGDLEGLDRGAKVPEARAIDLREVGPQHHAQRRVGVRGQAVDHLAVGPLQRLPVLALGHDRVDRLERLEHAGVVGQHAVEALERGLDRGQLVA